MSVQTDMAAVVDALKHPPALEKARALFNFARGQGSVLAEFEVTLSTDEAFQLMDWVHDYSGVVAPEGMAALEGDMQRARRANDPWIVLQHFTFYGLKTAPQRILQ